MLRLLANSFRLVNNFSVSYFNSTQSLKTLSFFKWLVILGFGFGVLISYIYSYYYIMLAYGLTTLVLAFAPYVAMGIVFSLWLVVTRRTNMVRLFLAFMFLPPTLITQYGITSDLLLLIVLLVCFLEKRNRQRVVSRVAYFSEEYTLKELYQKRLANKNNYKEYITAFSDLNYIQIEDFSLIREELIKVRNHKLGLAETKRRMTFKIKGVVGKTTVVDDMTFAPKKRSIANLFKRGI